jgi:hypothetical protein
MAAGLLLLVAATRPAVAADVWPYRVAVMGRAPRFTDPQLDTTSSATPTVSYPDLTEVLVRALRGDARFDVVDAEDLLGSPNPTDEQRARQLGDALRDLGIEEFGQYEIESSIADLEDSVRFYREAHTALSDPREVAPAYEYLARGYLERAHLQPDRATEAEPMARQAFKEMIRLNPAAPIREGLYPPEVVAQFQQAFLELMRDDGRELSMSDSAAAELLQRWHLDVIVYPFFLRDASGSRLVFEVHAVEGIHVQLDAESFRTVVPLASSQEAALDQVDRAFSRFLACLPVRYRPPPPRAPGDAGRSFLQAGWSASVYGDKPTDAQFLNQGVSLTYDYHLTDNLGFFGRANIQFGGRDPNGDLLSGFTSTRTALGVALSYRFGLLRLFLGTGLEVNFVSSFTATDDFWCKVTGGRFETFGVGQDCLPSDVTHQAAVTLLGPYLMPGASFDLAPPFGLYLLGSFAFYVSSTSAHIDFPIGGEAGIEYRF